MSAESTVDALCLPPEAWVNVLSFADPVSVATCVSLVSHRLHALASDPQLWRLLALRHLSSSSCAAANLFPNESDGWQKTFFAHLWLRHSRRLRFAFLGYVDCGKSTLIGRLLGAVGAVSKEQLDEFKKQATEMGKGSFVYAWVCDGSRSERERGITMEWRLKECQLANGREVELVDVPGHRAFVKNAIQGASLADVAVLVVAAGLGEFEVGISDTRNFVGGTIGHLQLASTLGMKRLIVVVNKMDDSSVNFQENRFKEIRDEVLEQAVKYGYAAADVVVVPISAWSGDNVTKPFSASWYGGATLLEIMEQCTEDIAANRPLPTGASPTSGMLAKRPLFGPTRLSVVRRVSGRRRGTANPESKEAVVVEAVVQSGTVRTGQLLEAALPAVYKDQMAACAVASDAATTVVTVTVADIQRCHKPAVKGSAGELVGLRLVLAQSSSSSSSSSSSGGALSQLKRGVVLAAVPPAAVVGDDDGEEKERKLAAVASFTGRIRVLRHPTVIRAGYTPFFTIHSATLPCKMVRIVKKWDAEGNQLQPPPLQKGHRQQEEDEEPQASFELRAGESGLVVIKPLQDVYMEPFARNEALGTFVITDMQDVVGSGTVESVDYRSTRKEEKKQTFRRIKVCK